MSVSAKRPVSTKSSQAPKTAKTSRSPKVSIAMPVYNGGDYFAKAVGSALAQTYDNIEIVIVNDGSRDGGHTDAVARRFAAAHPDKIRYVLQPNAGVAGALNTAIKHMTGDIFCWLSHDDLFEPEKTEIQVEIYKSLNRNDIILFSDYTLIDENDNVKTPIRFDTHSFHASPGLPLYRGCINGCTIFVPRALLSDTPFDLQWRYTQDYWLWKDLLRKAEFIHIPQSLVRYRQHSGQDSHKPAALHEGETLWRAIVDDCEPHVRTQLYGSNWRFLNETFRILDPSPYHETAAYLQNLRERCLAETLVSVVIPFYNEVELTLRALASARLQTHANLEILLVDDGSKESVEAVLAAASEDSRVRVIHQANAGAGAARNHGLRLANGEYIAFLDCDDCFVPDKIEVQLRAMAQAGALLSHTSYYISYDARRAGLGFLNAGQFSGDVYPAILQGCPMATPTVMIHRNLLTEGFQFPEATALGEDILAWVEVAQRRPILGIDRRMTIVEWADGSAAVNLRKGIEGLAHLVEVIEASEVHGGARAQIATLKEAENALRRLEIQQAPDPLNRGLIDLAFGLPGGLEANRAPFVPGQAMAAAGRFDSAIASLKAYLDYDLEHDAAFYCLASCYASTGRTAEAERLFARDHTIPLGDGRVARTSLLLSDPKDEAIAAPTDALGFGGDWEALVKSDEALELVALKASELESHEAWLASRSQDLHIHLSGLDADPGAILGRLKSAGLGRLSWSYVRDASRYARFGLEGMSAALDVAPTLLARLRRPLVARMAAADGPASVPSRGWDVGLYVDPLRWGDLFRLVDPRQVAINTSPRGLRYLESVRGRLDRRDDGGLEAALALALLEEREALQIANMGPAVTARYSASSVGRKMERSRENMSCALA